MTIQESLLSLSTYPIPVVTIANICDDRGLEPAADKTAGEALDLAKADVWVWLYDAPNLSEQGISISLTQRSNLLAKANAIYDLYGDETISGQTVGFIGEDFNG